MLKQILIWGGVLIAVLLVVIVIRVSPRFIIGILTYGRQAREGTLQVGDPAPVVSLVDVDGSTSHELSEWIGPRPLVLVFGSFT